MAENQNNLYQSKSAIANKFLNPNGKTSTLDEIITQVVPGTTLTETTSTPAKEYQSKPAVANKFLNTDGTYSTLDEILARTIGGITQFDVQVVEELPEVGEKGVLYLVPNEGSGGNIYDEYVWIPSTESFEKIGTTEIDLSGYEQLINKVTSISSSSTDTQYPSAKAVFDSLPAEITLTGDYTWLTPGEYTISTAEEVAKLEELEVKIRAGNMPNFGFELYGANAKIKITHFEYDSNLFWLNGLWYTDFNSIGIIGIRILRTTESDVDAWTIQTEECSYIPDFVGTNGGGAGVRGLVPAPLVSDVGKYLKADGTWASVPNPSNITQQEIISLFS